MVSLHFSRIEVTNFRNFRHLVIDRFPSPAVIVGENGVGKSNLLDALRLVLDPALPDSRRLLRAEDIWDGFPGGLAAGVEVTVVVELQGYDDDEDAKGLLGGCTIGTSPYTARLTYRFAPRRPANTEKEQGEATGDTQPLTSQDYDFVVFGGLDEGEDVRSIRRDVAIRILPALRDAESDLQSWRRNPLRELLEHLPLDPANLKATADAVASAVDQLTADPSIDTLQTDLGSRLDDMLGPRLSVEPTLGFTSSQPDELVRAVRLFVDADRRRAVSESSLGSANIIYLALLLEVLRRQRIDDQFVATLVAVEEPEAHLHVALQRKLFHYLLRSEPSLVLTTHSPHIAAVTPVKSFVVLRATADGSVGASTADLTLAPQQAEDLERYIDVSRAEILFAAAVILVEGLAELYVLPSLAKAAGFDLDGHGVIVASAHGTDFRPFHELLGDRGLRTPHFIVTDGDSAPNKRGRVEAGLKRAAALTPIAEHESLKERIAALPNQADADYWNQRRSICEKLETFGIFVGAETLEADVCPVFPSEMEEAFNELTTSAPARADVRNGIENETASPVDADIRAAMLSRFSARGKGRYAQRLASHLEKANLIERLNDTDPADSGTTELTTPYDNLRAGYLFRALDAVSQAIRTEPLLKFPPRGQDADEQ
ncbi:ATP-dependent endonuclease [Mycolicibacterium agri]|uniref:ATP-dependent endonuclease n=1 Tax=Mycolicibacterium agri TaxID=36811 RepID=A0A2A7MPZ5_MYCAG|nr:ATP-dependent endonuclease [Mycolicibacterium agri]